jgi:O-antigen ligase
MLLPVAVGVCLLSALGGLAPLAVWGGCLGIALLFWCFTSPLKGMTLVIALSGFIVRSTEEITPFEIGYGILIVVVMLGWIARRLALGRPFTASRTDQWLVWFLVIGLLSILPAYFYGNDPLNWAREFEPLLFFLPYLLLVTSVRQASDIRRLCFAYIAVCLSVGIVNLVDYQTSVSTARYVWELVAGRQPPGESLFFVTLTMTTIWVAFKGYQGWRTLVWAGLILFCLAALAITFSRAYWIAAVVALIVAILLMPKTPRRRALLYFAAFAAGAALLAMAVAGPLFWKILAVLGERFESILGAGVDLSFRNRLAESAGALDRILANPVWGYGFGYYYFFDPVIPYQLPTWYVHNAYLYLWLKLGLLGLIAFLVWYGSVLRHACSAYRSTTDPFLKPLLLGIASVMIAMIPLSVTSPQFIQKDSILFLAIGMSIAELAHHRRIAADPPEKP